MGTQIIKKPRAVAQGIDKGRKICYTDNNHETNIDASNALGVSILYHGNNIKSRGTKWKTKKSVEHGMQ